MPRGIALRDLRNSIIAVKFIYLLWTCVIYIKEHTVRSYGQPVGSSTGHLYFFATFLFLFSPETTRLIRGRSPHISFAIHMRELGEEKKSIVLTNPTAGGDNNLLSQPPPLPTP